MILAIVDRFPGRLRGRDATEVSPSLAGGRGGCDCDHCDGAGAIDIDPGGNDAADGSDDGEGR